MTYMTQPGSICSTLEQTHLTIFGVQVTSNHFDWLQDLWKLYTLSGTSVVVAAADVAAGAPTAAAIQNTQWLAFSNKTYSVNG